ncbi:hypothetical protein F0U59_42160 [Archangium gephyra]|nr:hypothetical protein F0U59_42160 [Archangium gephyra]
MRAFKALVVLLVLGGALPASAERDTFFLGTGQSGQKNVDAEETINIYAKVTGFSGATDTQGPTSITTTNRTAAFSNGQLVLVLQTVGTGLSSDPITLNDLDDASKVGRWEFARLRPASTGPSVPAGVEADKLNLAQPLVYKHFEANRTQVISVPEYTSVYVSDDGVIKAKPWSATEGTGGVLVFLVRDTLVNDGHISADGAGFKGGNTGGSGGCGSSSSGKQAGAGEGLNEGSRNALSRSRSANAGGGGPCPKDDGGGGGGGGGGNAGKGGTGGKTAGGALGGEGGAQLSYAQAPWRLILGGGGGQGYDGIEGGSGGGAIFIRAGTMVGAGRITADGSDGVDAAGAKGGGGGGAGGSIILRVAGGMLECPSSISAKGGKGGNATATTTPTPANYGPGGGGGSGRIFFQAKVPALCNPSSSPPGNAGTLTNNAGFPHGATTPTAVAPTKSPSPEENLNHPGDVVVDSISDMPRGIVNVRRPSVTVKVSESAGRKVYLRFNDGDLVGPLSGTGPYTGNPSGDLRDEPNKVVPFVEHNGLWNVGPTVNFTVDATPPNTFIPTAPPLSTEKKTNSTTARFVFSASETATFECNRDGEGFVPCDRETTYLGLDQGLRTLLVRATDLAGLVDPEPASHSWLIDSLAPDKPTVTPPTSVFKKGDAITLTGSAEPGAGIIVYIDNDLPSTSGSANGSGFWTFTRALIDDGLHFVRVRARDDALNESVFSDAVVFSVDATDPLVTFVHPGTGGPIRDNPLVIRGKVEADGKLEVGSDVEITLRKGTDVIVEATVENTSGEWLYEVTASLSDGDYVVEAVATDAAGNTGPAASLSFTLDRTPPNTTITCPTPLTNPFTNANTLSYAFGSSDGSGVSFQCVLNGDFVTLPLGDCSGALTYSANGVYTLLVRAADVLGNVDPSPASCTWTWDKERPGKVLIKDSPPKVTNSRLAVFKFEATDALSEPVDYQCSVDGSAFADCTNPYAHNTVAKPDGSDSHELKVIARDRAGNSSLEETVYTWSVDTGLPVSAITPLEGASNPTRSMSPTFEFKLKVPIINAVEYRYILNNLTSESLSDFTIVPGSTSEDQKITVTVPSDKVRIGPNSIRVIAHDTVLNVSTPRALQEIYNWEVDRTAPKVKIERHPAEWERFTTATFEFSAPDEQAISGFSCAINNCLVSVDASKDCTDVLRGTRSTYEVREGLREGNNCITVWSKDLAGNPSDVPESYQWNVDTESPAPPVIDAYAGELKVTTRFPAVEGNCEPFGEVALFLDNATEPVAVAVANKDGRWRAQISQQEVLDGSHNLRGQTKDRAGNESGVSESITLLVDSQSPARVTGGGLGCASSGNSGALLALLGLAGWMCQGKRRRGWE